AILCYLLYKKIFEDQNLLPVTVSVKYIWVKFQIKMQFLKDGNVSVNNFFAVLTQCSRSGYNVQSMSKVLNYCFFMKINVKKQTKYAAKMFLKTKYFRKYFV